MYTATQSMVMEIALSYIPTYSALDMKEVSVIVTNRSMALSLVLVIVLLVSYAETVSYY